MISHRHLISTLARQQLADRFRGSLFGWLWTALGPLLTILLLSFVFGDLLKVRWNVDSAPAYPIVLFGGLIVHFFLAECLVRAPTLIQERPEYVHKMVFPLHIVGAVLVLESTMLLLASLAVFLPMTWLFGIRPSAQWVLLPVVLLPLPLYGLAIAWGLGALGPYVPDLKQLAAPAASALLLLSPVLYPLESVPAALQPYYYLNPTTAVVQNLRQTIFSESVPDPITLALPLLASLLLALAAKAIFDKLKRGFADVI